MGIIGLKFAEEGRENQVRLSAGGCCPYLHAVHTGRGQALGSWPNSKLATGPGIAAVGLHESYKCMHICALGATHLHPQHATLTHTQPMSRQMHHHHPCPGRP